MLTVGSRPTIKAGRPLLRPMSNSEEHLPSSGTPSEVFYFGLQWYVCVLTFPLACIISSALYLPVFYRLDITSVYEVGSMTLTRTTQFVPKLYLVMLTYTVVT